MGAWKDFIKAFSVGIKPFSLLQLKNIIEAVDAAQKLTVYGALFAIIISGVLIMGRLNDPSTLGPNLAVCFLSGFYAVIIEFLLLPLRLNAEPEIRLSAAIILISFFISLVSVNGIAGYCDVICLHVSGLNVDRAGG